MTKRSKKNSQLDEYEKEIEENMNEAKPLSKSQKEKQAKTLKEAAENYVTKDKRINIRVYGSDLDRIKRIAMQEGLPYQTLITSVLHKFATGQLVSNKNSS